MLIHNPDHQNRCGIGAMGSGAAGLKHLKAIDRIRRCGLLERLILEEPLKKRLDFDGTLRGAQGGKQGVDHSVVNAWVEGSQHGLHLLKAHIPRHLSHGAECSSLIACLLKTCCNFCWAPGHNALRTCYSMGFWSLRRLGAPLPPLKASKI